MPRGQRALGQKGTKLWVRTACESQFLERGLVDLVFGDLRGNAPPRHAANLRTAADVAVAPLHGFADVLFLDLLGHLAQQIAQGPVQVEFERWFRRLRR